MRARLVAPLLLCGLTFGALPALADDNGSSEKRTVDRSCAASAESRPDNNQYSAPTGQDCRDANNKFNGAATYKATYNSNDVNCGAENGTPKNPTGIGVWGKGGTDSGAVGLCSEGTGPVSQPGQGRVSGGLSGDGVVLVVDGDKDNAVVPAQGWVSVRVGPSGPSYKCGDEHADGGKSDSESPQERDNATECGS